MADLDRLVELNDRRLEPLIRAADRDREAVLEQLIVEVAEPVLRSVLERYSRPPNRLPRHDLEDIGATVRLRLVQKLRALRESEDDAIVSFDNYVAVIAHNAFSDLIRAIHPGRARLKSSVRYVLRTEARLHSWTSRGRDVCGLRRLGELEPHSLDEVRRLQFPPAVFLQTRPSAAIVALFETIRGAMLIDDVVSLLGILWRLNDATSEAELAELSTGPMPSPTAELETRQYLASLWPEIVALRPLHRKALLLNLRAGEELNLLSLLVLGNVASFDRIAETLELSPAQLAGFWNRLPLDDNDIAAMIGGTRQQVINLRQSARERLSRRMQGK